MTKVFNSKDGENEESRRVFFEISYQEALNRGLPDTAIETVNGENRGVYFTGLERMEFVRTGNTGRADPIFENRKIV